MASMIHVSGFPKAPPPRSVRQTFVLPPAPLERRAAAPSVAMYMPSSTILAKCSHSLVVASIGRGIYEGLSAARMVAYRRFATCLRFTSLGILHRARAAVNLRNPVGGVALHCGVPVNPRLDSVTHLLAEGRDEPG